MVKSTSIDPSVVDADGVYRKVGPARVFTRETEAIQAIKGGDIKPERLRRRIPKRHGRPSRPRYQDGRLDLVPVDTGTSVAVGADDKAPPGTRIE